MEEPRESVQPLLLPVSANSPSPGAAPSTLREVTSADWEWLAKLRMLTDKTAIARKDAITQCTRRFLHAVVERSGCGCGRGRGRGHEAHETGEWRHLHECLPKARLTLEAEVRRIVEAGPFARCLYQRVYHRRIPSLVRAASRIWEQQESPLPSAVAVTEVEMETEAAPGGPTTRKAVLGAFTEMYAVLENELHMGVLLCCERPAGWPGRPEDRSEGSGGSSSSSEEGKGAAGAAARCPTRVTV